MLLVLGLPSDRFVPASPRPSPTRAAARPTRPCSNAGVPWCGFLAPAAEYVLVSGNREALGA